MIDNLMDKIVALCKRRGFIYPGSEIYGGLQGTWDYGPLGTQLKKNIKDLWWKDVVQLREDMVGIDTSIMLNPKVWEASGHVEAFTDPLVECKKCHKRFREDHVREALEYMDKHKPKVVGSIAPREGLTDLLSCPEGGGHQFSDPQKFNLLVKAYLGVIEGRQSEIYLRGEITQGVHINFKNVLDSSRVKIPFGIAQIGKAFRNEITPGNFTFRSREFEQMEIQYYIRPDESEGNKWYEYWKDFWMSWYIRYGIKKENLRFKEHQEGERAHYAKAATDIEYDAPFSTKGGPASGGGWSEFMGIHHRGDWDLKRHQEYSGQDLRYRDPDSSEEYLPYDIESSAGVDRSLLFFIIDAYSEDNGRVLLKLHPKLAPYKVAVFPLLANKPDLVKKAREIYLVLKQDFMSVWDERGNIGGRYASQDEVGTPFCITVDFQSLKDDTVTVRDRDTTKQDREKISELRRYLGERMK